MKTFGFYITLSLIVAALLYYSFAEEIESSIDRASLYWLQMRSKGMKEEEYAES